MKVSTALNHRDRAISAIRDIWSSARIYHSTHDDILKRLRSVNDSIAHCPAWVRGYVDGYDKALFDANWQYLEFCYAQIIDGETVLFSTHKDSTHRKTEEFYNSGRGHELSTLEGRHYWKGTNRPF